MTLKGSILSDEWEKVDFFFKNAERKMCMGRKTTKNSKYKMYFVNSKECVQKGKFENLGFL